MLQTDLKKKEREIARSRYREKEKLMTALTKSENELRREMFERRRYENGSR